MDVVTAFLYGYMPPEPTLYLDLPPGYPVPDHLRGKSDLVGPVKKGMYGLKQSPRRWNATVNDFMIDRGSSRSLSFNCLRDLK